MLAEEPAVVAREVPHVTEAALQRALRHLSPALFGSLESLAGFAKPIRLDVGQRGDVKDVPEGVFKRPGADSAGGGQCFQSERGIVVGGDELPCLIHVVQALGSRGGFRGFGAQGPLSQQRVYDNVIQACAGIASAQSDDSGEPRLVRQLLCDKLTSITTAPWSGISRSSGVRVCSSMPCR